jgi:uncharacterized damage-inducible protein DinB
MREQPYPSVEIAQWVETWSQTRALTYDLLRALPYSVMNFSPHPGFGTLIRQIRHAADMQGAYIAAVRTGRMDFAAAKRQRTLEQSKEDLEGYLRHLDEELLAALQGLAPEQLERPIDWGDAQVSLRQHLMWLLRHETLHHGMWVFYARIADLPLPRSWQRAWRLG